ncbi:citrate lyase subunit gamma (acyl carrier protein) [Bifidobacterium bohemicum]|uniref:Citrate lyase acyl carrier protein n=1 Tax=Bifidobacterium bohemicum DSM 22767 TaxID=1437606 RepID=A0A086ZEV4_9BIFI|nr:citrate lyase acyl carrier protein [Bifidobacterium bohemicum]KFI45054.1 citrate lyase, gamma subunit [Bifidobacterium bohemicum DSM 22767]SCB92646.1 citrate lyase subunit gamma (acyl carrier protein) [Bifidobacterium bohemicum]
MDITRTATAGTLESSDIQVTLAPGGDGIDIDLTSDVIKQFGEQIKATITSVLKDYGITSAKVKAVDKGALDIVIKARTVAAVQRALDIVEQPKWEVL